MYGQQSNLFNNNQQANKPLFGGTQPTQGGMSGFGNQPTQQTGFGALAGNNQQMGFGAQANNQQANKPSLFGGSQPTQPNTGFGCNQ